MEKAYLFVLIVIIFCVVNYLFFNKEENSENKELIQELYESYSGYFSYSEIARALFINKDDISVILTFVFL